MSLLRHLLRAHTRTSPRLPLSCHHPPFFPALPSPPPPPPCRRFSPSLSVLWPHAIGVASQTLLAQGNETLPRLGRRQQQQQQQRRRVYVFVDDEDFDQALRIYGSKMNATGLEKALKERQFYTKPSEKRKLAKHYKKLNRARREFSDKLHIVKEQLEYRRKMNERRKREKNES